MKNSALAVLTAAGLSAAAAHASTSEVSYQNAGSAFGDNPLSSAVTIDSEVYDGTFNAGQFAMTSAEFGDFFAFCVEVTQALQNGATYENLPDLLGADVQINVSALFNTAYDQVVDSLTAAAFQVALWEIVEDTETGLDLASGTFSAVDANSNGGSVVGTATDFLDGLADAPTGLYDITFLGSAASQDLVTASLSAQSASAPAPVPLPASGLFLLSAAGLIMVRRKKR